MAYNFIEVCSGCGGLSTGLIKAGLTPILLNDYNNDCCETLTLNHHDVLIKQCSLLDLKLSDYINKVDLLCGGVPCQSFSSIGKRKGLKDTRGQLLMKFIDLITLIEPKIFMIENVTGLLTHNKGRTFKSILNKIKKSKLYNVKYEVLNAVNYNVPQNRKRLILIGTNKKYNVNFEYPQKNDNILTLNDVLNNVPHSIGYDYKKDKEKLYDLIPQGGNYEDLPKRERTKYESKHNTLSKNYLFRLSLNKPSPTLLCSPCQSLTERCHPLISRPLNIREYARIQTFDESSE